MWETTHISGTDRYRFRIDGNPLDPFIVYVSVDNCYRNVAYTSIAFDGIKVPVVFAAPPALLPEIGLSFLRPEKVWLSMASLRRNVCGGRVCGFERAGLEYVAREADADLQGVLSGLELGS